MSRIRKVKWNIVASKIPDAEKAFIQPNLTEKRVQVMKIIYYRQILF